ncbi:MAG: hypothetical protein ACE5LU_25675 [Anaerolineae bacterium]
MEEQTTGFSSAEAEVGLGLGPRLREVTVGGALAGVIVVVAVLTRLYDLGGRPLNTMEAARALAALHFVQGQPADFTAFSPLLTNLNLLVLFLAGTSDFWARLVPALFGILLVALPIARFRHRLGPGGALAASALVALSPTFLLFSRSVSPALLTAVTSLVFVGAAFDFIDRHRQRDLLVAAGALALSLTAGPGIYTVLLFMSVFGIGTWLLHRYRGAAGWGRIAAIYQVIKRDRDGVTQMGVVFGVTFVVAATGFLVNFGGIQAVLNLFVDWLASFSLSREYPGWYYAGTVLLYEPAILLFGLLGAGVVVQRRDLFGVFLVTWFGGSLVLYTLVGRTEPSLIVPILLPLALLAGSGVASIFEFAASDEALRGLLVPAFVIPLMTYAVLQLAFYVETATRSVNLFLAMGAAAMAAVVAVVFASSRFGMAWRPATVARGVGISLLMLSLGLTLHMAWHLNFLQHKPVRELMLAEPTSPDVRDVVEVLEAVSQDRVGDTVSIPITVDGQLAPTVAWYLQDFTNVTVLHEVRQPPGTPVVIMPATDEEPAIGDQYEGQGFRLSYRWRPTGLTGSDLARWYFYREGPAVPTSDLIVFVVRQ